MDTNIANNTKNTAVNNNTVDLELITAYTQLVFKTLRHSKSELYDRTIRNDVKMFYEKFRK